MRWPPFATTSSTASWGASSVLSDIELREAAEVAAPYAPAFLVMERGRRLIRALLAERAELLAAAAVPSLGLSAEEALALGRALALVRAHARAAALDVSLVAK